MQGSFFQSVHYLVSMKNFVNTLAFKRACAIGWFVLIILGSSIPGKDIPHIFKLTPDKVIHGCEYLVFGFFIRLWLSTQFDFKNKTYLTLAVILLGSFCGMVDELYQHLTPNRTPDFYDWCTDFVAITLSNLIFNFWENSSVKK